VLFGDFAAQKNKKLIFIYYFSLFYSQNFPFPKKLSIIYIFALDRFAHLGFVRFFSGSIPKSVQCSKFTFLYNKTLENIINYELGIEEFFFIKAYCSIS
jgi:hypothetical protein